MIKDTRKIAHIDGLSGELEKLAIEVIMEERESRLGEGLCPDCGQDTLEMHKEPDGPDDYTTEIYCTNKKCGFYVN